MLTPGAVRSRIAHSVRPSTAPVLASNAGVPARIAEAQAAQDLGALGFVAHSLKGMSGTLHAGALRALATRVETLVRRGDAGAWALCEALEGALAELLDALRARRRTL